MTIKEPFNGNIIGNGMVIQHQSQLKMGIILVFIDWKWKVNKHNEFTYII